MTRSSISNLFFMLLIVVSLGCQKQSTPVAVAPVPTAEAEPEIDLTPLTYEATAEQLLAARLPLEATSQGWIRLFDGHTLFGWEIAGRANWRVENETIIVDRGEKGFLCTSVPWQDFELTLEFNCDAQTNSGVFLRTPLKPENPAVDCYEVNIAPDDNPFPTASVVQRQKVDADKAPEQKPNVWRRMTMLLEGNHLQVSLDDTVVTDYTDVIGLENGRISLQHNTGRVAFRDVRLRPIGLTPLVDADLTQWTRYPKMTGEFTVDTDNVLQVDGGKTQLETKELFGDFVLQTDYKTAEAKTNSGIFFRCIPGDEMMGYECQVNNEMVDGMPLKPADCGAGGIFRRQDARVVAGNLDDWSSLVLVAHGLKMAAWVNGVQVSDFQDDRPSHENPRQGSRLDPGTIMIQGHDATTKAWFRNLSIRQTTSTPSSPDSSSAAK
jgi:Domain of Unknown Function (DUF1080)